MKQNTHLLTPTILTESDIAHKSVDELTEVLKEKDCRNIAITGTYGSGKSSIIRTLQSEVGNEYRFVNISLSTLDKEVQDIESSIVQQLLYKTDSSKSGEYRYTKPSVLTTKRLIYWICHIVILIIAICVAFEPQWLRIEGLYSIYGFLGYKLGYWINVIADIFSFVYIIYFIVILLCKVIKHFHCYTIKRLDIYNTSIEFSEEASIFNKHLNEIECFFRATKTNVVVFEDLDRIENPQSLFLKLRELNAILNDSAEIKREHTIRFIYAIRDDVFIGEQRTKYFDYIVSAIPVVNANNSADYLISQYGEIEGRTSMYRITNQQWQELGSYIHGMRELHNVVNEFLQYKAQVGESLEEHKLFAITIYKNKYPQDYSLLHSKSGVLYYAISAKKEFSDKATKTMVEKYYSLKDRIDGLRAQRNAIRNNYIQYLKKSHNIERLIINGKEYALDKVRDIDELFRAFMENSVDKYVTDTSREAYDLVFAEIDSELNNGNGYIERLRELESEIPQTIAEQSKLEHQIISLANSSLANIISSIKDGKEALDIIKTQYEVCYTLGEDKKMSPEALDQCKMILFMLRNGYVDENYPQYISYFYPGSLTDNDNKYLQSITLGITLGYNYKLDNVADVVNPQRMFTEYFDSKTALNIDVVDYLTTNSDYHTFLDRMLLNIKVTPSFIIDYEKAGKESSVFFEYVLTRHDWFLDVAFDPNNIEFQDELVVLFFKYCPMQAAYKYKRYSNELDDLYSVISNNIVLLDINHLCDLLKVLKLNFTRINDGITDSAGALYNFVLDHSLYAINIENVKTILAEEFELKTITSICHNSNRNVYENMWRHLDSIHKFIPDTCIEEEEDAMKAFINDSRIPSDFKQDYIGKQLCILKNLDGVNIDVMSILFATDHIEVSWHNIFDCYFHKTNPIEDYLIEFIIRHCDALMDKTIEYIDMAVARRAFDSLFANNALPEDVYAKLLPLFSFNFAEDEDLSELSAERMNIIIANNKLEYGDDSFAMVKDNFSADILANFAIENIGAFLDDSNGASNEVYNRILESEKIDIESKVKLLDVITEIGNDSYASKFANNIFNVYLDINFTSENNTELILDAIKYCTSWELKIKTINRINQILPYNKERETKMIEALGGGYPRLNKLYGHTYFDVNKYNEELLEYLKNNGHNVSDYYPDKENNQRYKVTFKHN